MKKLYFLTTLVVLSAATFKANAQSNDDGISDLFKGNPGDVNKLINAYTNPLFKGFGNSLNGGWTNTAKTLTLGHFDLRISASASIIPQADRTFDINALGLTNIKATSSPIAPTFGGSDALSTGITISDPADPNNPNRQYKTTLPKGVTQYVPAPQIQLTVGLIKNTDVTLRLIPTTKITDDVGSVGMVGFGVKHNIIQDFAKGAVRPFDLSVAVGYTRLSYNKPLSVRPETNNGGTTGSQDYSNQRLEGHFSGWNAQVILSKKFAIITPFVAVGFLTSKTDVGLKGNFPFVTGVTPSAVEADRKPTYTTYANPITIGGSSSSQVSGLRADLGFQLELSIVRIYASGSLAEYKSVNAGIGFGF
ncbi:DUF6588 family protein [Mucilaginibacter antarcticus]|uniref:DUF6588 family protein n=1 Tax=Mucilaginibacter antarcticus TaxID=1855725 RepID=A0ABW5XSQ4_9SPHI